MSMGIPLRIVAGTAVAALLFSCVIATPASAKKFKYSAGPKAPEDTVLSVAELEIEQVVSARGPRVPATNLQMTSLVANTAFERAMSGIPLGAGKEVVVAPAESHPLNFVVEHAVLRQLSNRQIVALVRRAPVPEDSLGTASLLPTYPILDYQLASARVTYLRLRGWLPGRIKIERQTLVEGRLTLREPVKSRVLWTGDATWNFVDAFPRQQLPLVEDARFADLNGSVPERNLTRVFEPVIVVGVVAGLVALFFQNRP